LHFLSNFARAPDPDSSEDKFMKLTVAPLARSASCLLATSFLLAAPIQAQSADVDAYIRDFIQRRNIPGVSVSVIHEGDIVHAAGYGMANLELSVPATEKTVYEIGSISKQFAAEAAMILVEEGKLSLEDPIQKYIPGTPDSWKGITVRHIIGHTGGIPDWESRGLLSYRREYTPAEFIALLAPIPLDFAPGERWSYNNSDYPLLGFVIEAASGMDYEQFVTERIFVPAGMTDTRFKHAEQIVRNRSGGYVGRNGTLIHGEPLRPRVIAPSGGIMSTSVDMARWLLALTSGRIMKPETFHAMLQPVRLNDGSTFNAGFSWFLDNFRGHRNYLHNGSTVTGFSSVIYWYPEERLGLVALMNIDRFNAVNVLAQRTGNFFVPGISMGALAERPDPDPALTARLLQMLKDVAESKDNDLLAARFRDTAGGKPRTTPSFGYNGPVKRFSFVDRDDLGPEGMPRWGSMMRWVSWYRLDTGERVLIYTVELTPEGKVARFYPEQH
jgi:D-alanyl-D-alanine carboxypeptidase